MSGPFSVLPAASTPLRLLIVDSLPATASSLSAALRQAGITALRCPADEAAQSVRIDEPDLVLLDPSRIDSWRAARAIRRAGHDVGLVLLTDAEVACAQVETWLDDADDLLIGTIEPREVIAHCRAVDRRRRGHATARLVVRGVGVDHRAGEMLVGDRRIPSTKTERALLGTLLRRAGCVVNREALMLDLYGDGDWPNIKIVDVLVCKLRRRLSALGAPADLIETVHGIGFAIRRQGMPAAAERRAA